MICRAGTAARTGTAGHAIVGDSCVIGNRKGSVPSQGPAHTTADGPGVKALRDRLRDVRNGGIVSVSHVELTTPDAPQLMVCTKIELISRGPGQHAAATRYAVCIACGKSPVLEAKCQARARVHAVS